MGFCIIVDQADKPNSVEDDHLSGPDVTIWLERHSQPKLGTTLHAGKDLFVAFSPCDEPIPRGNPLPFGVGVSVVTSVLTDDGRYPLPISFLAKGACSDFPPWYLHIRAIV